jgi:RES domain-containing protein
MRVFRIVPPRYVEVALSGEGASRAGARWNSAGTRMGYTASSVSLVMLEMLVHVDRDNVPTGLRLLSFDVPDDAILVLNSPPIGWDDLPYSSAVRAVGDDWIQSGKSLALRVPSAVARHESSLLINPAHPRFPEIKLVSEEALVIDSRLFASG